MDNFILSTRFEVGFNIELDQYSPLDVINRYMSYSSSTSINPFFATASKLEKGKPIQRTCYLSDYNLKFYDKSKQAKISRKDLLRFEIVYTQLRKIKQVLGLTQIEKITLKLLNEVDTWNKLFKHHVKMYDAINKIPIVKENLSLEDIFKIHGFGNSLLKEDIKRNFNNSAYKKLRSGFKQVHDRYEGMESNYHSQVRANLVSKYHWLINN